MVRRAVQQPTTPLSAPELDALCQFYMPGVWPVSTITKYWKETNKEDSNMSKPYKYPAKSTGYETDSDILAINATAYGTAGTTIVMTLPSEIDTLLSHLDLTLCSFILDPWAGTCSIEAALLKRGLGKVISNDINPASYGSSHLDALRPSSYDHWADSAAAVYGRLSAIVTSPHWYFLDLAIPLAVSYAEEVACFHVPMSYVSEMPVRRKHYLSALARAGRLHVLQCDRAGAVGRVCAWLIIFKDDQARKRLAATPALRASNPKGMPNAYLTFT